MANAINPTIHQIFSKRKFTNASFIHAHAPTTERIIMAINIQNATIYLFILNTYNFERDDRYKSLSSLPKKIAYQKTLNAPNTSIIAKAIKVNSAPCPNVLATSSFPRALDNKPINTKIKNITSCASNNAVVITITKRGGQNLSIFPSQSSTKTRGFERLTLIQTM